MGYNLNEKLLSLCKAMLYLPITIDDFGIIDHPFFSSPIIYLNGQIIDITESEKKQNIARNQMKRFLSECGDISFLVDIALNKRYYLAFLEHAHAYMTQHELGIYIKHIYNQIEGFGQLNKQRKNNFLKLLLKADKQDLMDSEDMDFYNTLPNTVEVYRGVNGHNTKSGKVKKSFWESPYWTIEREQAIWFANRFANPSIEKIIYKITVPKEYIIFGCKIRKTSLCKL